MVGMLYDAKLHIKSRRDRRSSGGLEGEGRERRESGPREGRILLAVGNIMCFMPKVPPPQLPKHLTVLHPSIRTRYLTGQSPIFSPTIKTHVR
jgi:hypothetical protein